MFFDLANLLKKKNVHYVVVTQNSIEICSVVHGCSTNIALLRIWQPGLLTAQRPLSPFHPEKPGYGPDEASYIYDDDLQLHLQPGSLPPDSCPIQNAIYFRKLLVISVERTMSYQAAAAEINRLVSGELFKFPFKHELLEQPEQGPQLHPSWKSVTWVGTLTAQSLGSLVLKAGIMMQPAPLQENRKLQNCNYRVSL